MTRTPEYGECHRPLRDPASVAVGYGPVCARKHGVRHVAPAGPRKAAHGPRKARRGAKAGDVPPGQTELALDIQLEIR